MINDHASIPSGILGNLFVNKEGSHFVREDGRRDEISKAILNQTGGMYYVILSSDAIPNPDVNITLDGRTISFMLEHKLSGYVKADTLQELAGVIGVDANNLTASIWVFNDHVRSNTAIVDFVVFGRIAGESAAARK